MQVADLVAANSRSSSQPSYKLEKRMTVEKPKAPRKEYKKPVLVSYGSVEQLTNAVSSGSMGPDAGPGNSTKTS